jgi:hypothetical protein
MLGDGTIFHSLLNYSPNIPSGSCPTASWTMFERTFTLDSHCSFVESFQSLLSGIMVFVWGIGALFIVLSA